MVTSAAQRAKWERQARWLAELGLAEGEPAPVDVVEEVANATLSMLAEVERLSERVALLSQAVSEHRPRVATDLTFVRLSAGGAVSTTMPHWDGDHAPVVGERVLVSDGGPFMEAAVTAVEGDILQLQVTLRNVDTTNAPDPQSEMEQLRKDLAEARAFARGYEHGLFAGVHVENLPGWLTAPLTLDEG